METLIGKHITLRVPRQTDKRDRLHAGRDAEIRRSYGGEYSAEPPWTEADVEAWYVRLSQRPWTWIVDLDGRNIGIAGLHGIEETSRRARFAIGLQKRDDLSRGYGTEATRLVLKHGFESMRLHRIDLRVLAFNMRAIRCYEKCGFVTEGVERETLWQDGAWQSDVFMSILEKEYRALAPGWRQ